ncbi:hypothetical protein [Periweissella cryptocerci]|uniref:hypothetical protein n=1 Tax=Periweissella cryptocerci TaxID=2506420 RepID=UPI0014049C57|nr:hypothetical protein [Periweissella cryptocerci]
MDGKKKFSGTNRERLVDEMDTWLDANGYSLYGSNSIVSKQITAGKWELTVSWQGTDKA